MGDTLETLISPAGEVGPGAVKTVAQVFIVVKNARFFKLPIPGARVTVSSSFGTVSVLTDSAGVAHFGWLGTGFTSNVAIVTPKNNSSNGTLPQNRPIFEDATYEFLVDAGYEGDFLAGLVLFFRQNWIFAIFAAIVVIALLFVVLKYR